LCEIGASDSKELLCNHITNVELGGIFRTNVWEAAFWAIWWRKYCKSKKRAHTNCML